MDEALTAEIKRIRGKDFDKMLAIANPELGKAFEQEVLSFVTKLNIFSGSILHDSI